MAARGSRARFGLKEDATRFETSCIFGLQGLEVGPSGPRTSAIQSSHLLPSPRLELFVRAGRESGWVLFRERSSPHQALGSPTCISVASHRAGRTVASVGASWFR